MLMLAGLLAGTSLLAAEPFFSWDAKERRLSAEVESAPLKQTLSKLSAATGWKIYLAPQVNETVSVQFKDRPANDALRTLLGQVNFALVPGKGTKANLYVFRRTMSEATELVELEIARLEDWIKNELIVTLSPDSKRDIETLAKRWGAKIIARNDKLRTYRLQFQTEEAAEAARRELASFDDMRVDDNYYVRAPDRDDYQLTPNPGASASGAQKFDLTPTASTDGSHTVVAVIDTPMQPLDAARQRFILDGVNVTGAQIDPVNFAESGPTHGTSMVEAVLEGASNGSIRILPVNVYNGELDANGRMRFNQTTTWEVTVGVYEALRRGAKVINLSLGGAASSPLLDSLINQGRQRGVVFLAAAGNIPTTAPTYPAANPNVWAVTAAGADGQPASYANTGDFVDLIAPGLRSIEYGGTRYHVMGTSPATAYVSGIAASGLAGGQTPVQLEAELRRRFGWAR